MATDFQEIDALDSDVENFDLDLASLADSVFVGPQGELLETLDRFNAQYGSNLGVTKSFTLKPGGYDEIKKAYGEWCLRYDMKPRGIASLFDRIQQHKWRESNFKRDLLNIESKMKELKSSGMRWQNNFDSFSEEFDKLKSRLTDDLKTARELYPHLEIKCKLQPIAHNRLELLRQRRGRYSHNDRNNFPGSLLCEGETMDVMIMIYIKFKNLLMHVHVTDDDGTKVYRLPMGDLYALSGSYLLPMISRGWGKSNRPTGQTPCNSYSYFLECIYMEPAGMGFHPYVSRNDDKYRWDLGGEMLGGNICTGNMTPELRNSLINSEFLAHIVNINNWLTNYYVPQTYPLNRIRKARNFGDDILFSEWRNDLNNTSSRVFSHDRESNPLDGDGNLPYNCGMSGMLQSQLKMYCKNARQQSYGFSERRIDIASEEYKERLVRYINKIDVQELPCYNCTFLTECHQEDNIHMLFDNKEEDTQVEGMLGLLYEIGLFIHVHLESPLNDDLPLIFEYAEEVILPETYRSLESIEETYDVIVKSYRMTIWWFYKEGLKFEPNTHKFKSRCKLIYLASDDVRNELYKKHYANDESDFVWTVDNINNYITTLNPKEEECEQKAVFDPELIADMSRQLNDESANNSMTPEQRAIQWAIENGGAQNL